MNRRDFLGLLAMSALSGISVVASDIVFATDKRSASSVPTTTGAPDFSLRIAPVRLTANDPGATLFPTVAFDDMLRDGSTVLYVTSIGSFRVIPTYSAIGTAKACGESLVRYLAAELAHRGIRVNAISPPPFASQAAKDVVGDTDALMAATDAATPRGRRLELSEIADLAAYLTELGSSGITGQVITVDGGIFTTWRL